MNLILIYIFIIIILLSFFIGYKIGIYNNEKQIESRIKRKIKNK